jgi:hypothetical protein
MTREEAFNILKPFSGDYCVTGGILLWLPDHQKFISLAFGDGSNLLDEDEDEGCVDYIYIEIYEWDDGELIEDDGGEMMLDQENVDEYNYDITRAVPDVLKFMDLNLDGEEIPNFIPLQKYVH